MRYVDRPDYQVSFCAQYGLIEYNFTPKVIDSEIRTQRLPV
jgi:hypothetical protein